MTQQETEAKAELVATIQHDHVPMKQWYNSSPIAKKVLHLQYGSEYPAFARDVETWKGWKDARKLYLKDKESKESKQKQKVKLEQETQQTNQTQENGKPRKRRSRWGTAPPEAKDTSEPPRRKSRWARGRVETPKPVNGAMPFASGSVLDLLPGLPSSFSAAQSSELKELQAKLRTANFKLENLENEAKRVDALPVGHADRSPSPPPGTFIDLCLFV
jgi:hypothetical protein